MSQFNVAKILLTIAMTFLVATSVCLAEDNPVSRPKVGVVLAGGGAKGAAHIGVLKYLEEQGIPVDCIVGTSMGSIIGGLYALGYSPDEMNSIIQSVDWSYLMSNKVMRRHDSFDEKQRFDKYLFSIPFSIRGNASMTAPDSLSILNFDMLIQSGEIVNEEQSSEIIRSLPGGIINGNHVNSLFNNLSIRYQSEMEFKDLPIPFACIATNMLDGSQVVLKEGKIADAMRASMSIPLVFSPKEYEDKLLVDGGMVNNFPTDICKEMGADIIIGVELTKGFKANRNELGSFPGMLTQLMAIVTSGHNARNRQLCDLYIRPDMTGYGTMSFDTESIDSLVNRGYNEAARYALDLATIKKMVDINGPVGKRLQSVKAKSIYEGPLYISSVSINGLEAEEAAWLTNKWDFMLNKEITHEEINDAIGKYTGTGFFDEITYDLTAIDETEQSYQLDIYFKPTKPHTASFGIRTDSEEAISLGFKVGLNTNRMSGPKLIFDGKLGFNHSLRMTATYALPSVLNLNASVDFWNSKYSVYNSNVSNVSRMENENKRLRARAFISEFYSRNMQTALGFEYEKYWFNHLSSDSSHDVHDDGCDNAGIFGHFIFDDRDATYFTKHGIKGTIDIRYRLLTERHDPQTDNMHDISPDSDLIASFECNITPADGCITLIPKIYHRSILAAEGKEVSTYFLNSFGGSMIGRFESSQLPFIGQTNVEFSNYRNISIARCDLRWNFSGKNYLTAICNYMMEGERIDDYKKGSLGLALMYSRKTKIGPLSIDGHWSGRTNKLGVYLSLGLEF